MVSDLVEILRLMTGRAIDRDRSEAYGAVMEIDSGRNVVVVVAVVVETWGRPPPPPRWAVGRKGGWVNETSHTRWGGPWWGRAGTG